MGDRNELLNDIQKLKMERNRLLEQIKEAEQWESVAWDSYHAVELYVNSLEKKKKIAQKYWLHSQQDINFQFEFVVDQANRVKKTLDKKRYDLLDNEIDRLIKEIRELADILGLEIDELPKNYPFFALPVEEVPNE
ncbi:TPA: hypothetical protein U0595_001918 [Streptococcus suis]|uniref:hypothetical protein n=1 Tax=Streptococcus suis TaxID=1307 RepID=UPI002AA2E9A1|nr:hypothetical protein [Streptococcus suis]HEM2759522.1 hypothetical protein [Streptococcus suis]HEM2766061.1 hypothetical protein [Streptococcus suis]HEM3590664.1 hypothetical protein [Streptococcus suis]